MPERDIRLIRGIIHCCSLYSARWNARISSPNPKSCFELALLHHTISDHTLFLFIGCIFYLYGFVPAQCNYVQLGLFDHLGLNLHFLPRLYFGPRYMKLDDSIVSKDSCALLVMMIWFMGVFDTQWNSKKLE
jgi:hypothetical protein